MLTKIISESIEVDSAGNANCTQEVKYSNSGRIQFRFSGLSETFFHKDCEDFHFSKSSDTITPKKVDVQEEPHQKKLIYSIEGSIPPQQIATYALSYVWKDFRNEAGFKRISTRFDSLTSYNLTLIVGDDTFTHHLISVKDGDQILSRESGDYLVTEEGNLHLSRQHLSPNSTMEICISAKIKKIHLPVIKDTARTYENCFQEQHVVVNILHLLRDSLPFFDELLSMGVEKNDVFILGIPYSSKTEVVEHLKNDGFNVTVVEKARYMDEFLLSVKDVLTKACDLCEKTGKKLLIIEDGGYAVPLLHEDATFKDSCRLCFGAVEQTANGIKADRKLAEGNILSFPIMNVAESRIKRDRESPLVGSAIIQNINRLLDGYGYGLNAMKVAQIGFGSIGEALAKQLRADDIDVTIYDRDQNIRDAARRSGFSVADTLNDALPGKNLIIGCTGEEVVGLNELRLFDRGVFFVNATSKLRELKYKEFLQVADEVTRRRGLGTEYKLKGGREIIIRLLADGFPVNFFESSESIPDTQIQFIPALLLAAAGHLITQNICVPELIEIPRELEDELERLIKLYDRRE